MNQRIIVGVVAFIALCAGVVGALYIAPPSTSEPAYFQAYPTPRDINSFTLTSHTDEAFTQEDLKGHWSLVFLGYTFCPDICPTTMAELNGIFPSLQEINTEHSPQVVFVSVDPKRDTTERLAQYIGFFNNSFVAVTGEHKQLFPLARNLGMMYSMSDSTDNPNYLVDHSASVVVVNPQAQVVGRFKPHREPGQLAISDAQQILHDMPILMSE